MFIEIPRIVQAWFEDAANGVNAMVAGLTRDGADPAPAAVTVLEESTSQALALDHLPETPRPCVAIQHYQVNNIGPLVITGDYVDYKSTLLIRTGVRDDRSAAGLRDLLYLQHGILRSLTRLHANANAAARVRNKVMLVEFGEIAWVRHFAPVAGAEITAAFFVPYTARTLEP